MLESNVPQNVDYPDAFACQNLLYQGHDGTAFSFVKFNTTKSFQCTVSSTYFVMQVVLMMLHMMHSNVMHDLETLKSTCITSLCQGTWLKFDDLD